MTGYDDDQDDEDDEDDGETVAEMYARHEEDDRERWIPGYKEAKDELLAFEEERFRMWDRSEDYPPDTPRAKELRAKLSEWARQRGVPPWERPA